MWPMVGKTGVARVALLTKAPVIPVAQWGANEVLPPYTQRPQLLPAQDQPGPGGPPVDLAEFYGQEQTAELLRKVTEVIMDAVTDLSRELRGEPAPAERFDPRKHKGNKQQRDREVTTRCAVFGTGSWGTAFAMILADAGCEVTLWGRRAELAAAINATRTNPDYLPGVELPARGARPPPTRPRRPRDAEFVFLVVPSQTLRAQPGRVGAAAARPTPCWSA